MKRKLNRRLFLILAGSVIVLGVSLHFLHAAQVRRSAEVLLEQANKSEKDENYPRAQDYLERYLVVRPGDVDALLRLADLIEHRSGTPAQAVRVLERALRSDPSRVDVRKRVVKLWLDMQPPSFSGAKPHIDALLPPGTNVTDVEIVEMAGRTEEGLGHFEAARDHYQKALELAPDRVDTYFRLAELLRQRLNDEARANAVMDAVREAPGGLITSNPTLPKAYLARAGYRERHGIEGANDDIARALKLAPRDVDVLIAAGLLERDRGALEIARTYLDQARKLAPDRAEIYQALADLEIKSSGQATDRTTRIARMNEAVKWLEQGIERLPDAMTLQYSLAGTLAQAERLEDAKRVIEQLKKAQLRTELAQYLTGYVLMGQRRYQDALKELEAAQLYLASRHELRELNKRVLLMMGECYTQLGNLSGRYDAYRRAAAIDLEKDPLWASARLQLAEALRAQNKIDQAIQEYTLIAPRTPALWLPLAQLLTLQNLRLPPEKQSWQLVEKLLTDLAKTQPSSLEVPILRAEVLYARKQVPQAKALLEKTRDAHPDRVEPWLALAGLADRQGEDSLAVIQAAEQALGPRLALYMARAAYWARKKGPKAPDELVKLERVADGLVAEEQNQLWREIATAYAQLGVFDRAHRLWRQLSDRQPDVLATQLTGFDMALQARDEESARKNAERIRVLEGPDGTLYRYANALLLTRDAVARPATDPKRAEMLGQARELLVRVAAARPTWGRAVVAQAEVAVAQGLNDEAMRFYLRAIDELGDRSPGSMIAAAQVLYESKRFDDADRMIRLLRDQNVPISGELRRLVAEIAFQNRDYLRALEQAQEIVTDESEDPKDLIWLGRLRWAAGQPEAERALRRAVEKGPDLPEAHLTLVAYLSLNGRKEAALEALAAAEKQLPPETALLVLAEGNEVAGQTDRAREYYDQALKGKPDDLAILKAVASFNLRTGRYRDASANLRTLLEKHPDTAEARAARRTLVLITAASGNQKEAMKALENLGLADTPGATGMPNGSNLDDLRTRAQVLALQPNRLRRQEAINILNQIVAADRPRADDLFLLAQLHEANGNWDESRKTMRKLLDAAPEPNYLAAFARSLLRHESLVEAKDFLNRLERVAADSALTAEIKARVLHAEEKDAEATKIVRAFAAENPARLLSAAQLLEELRQVGPAEELYRQYVRQYESREAAAVLALATFLGRQGRTSEALDLIEEQVWNRLPPEVAANASVVLLYGSRADVAQFDRVDARLQKAITENPSAVSIQFDLANLRSLQGRYDEAADIYRTIFEREPTRGVPLNNLAWMLILKGGQPAEAMQAIAKAMELEGETPELLDTRALIYLAMNDADRAIQDLEDALVVQPKSAEMHFHLAQAYQKRGRTNDATDAFNQAKTLGLTAEKLHPLERPRFNRMAAEVVAGK